MWIRLLLLALLTSCAPRIEHERILAAASGKESFLGKTLVCERLSDKALQKIFVEGVPELQGAYQFKIENFREGEEYNFYVVNLEKCIDFLGEVVVDERGILLGVDPSNPECYAIKLAFNNFFMNGEGVSYVLEHKNGSNECLGTTIYPNPIEAQWEDGAEVVIASLLPTMELFSVKGKGFIPAEELQIISVSGDERIPGPMTVWKDGTWSMQLLPATIGHAGGEAELIVQRSSGERTLDFFWGKEAENEVLRK